MATFSTGDPGFKHTMEIAAKRIRRYFPTKTLASLLYEPMHAEAELDRQINIGTIKAPDDYMWIGSGVPSLTNVPTGGTAGEFYFRTDTPGTANQRIYICTVGTGNGTLGTWVALVV